MVRRPPKVKTWQGAQSAKRAHIGRSGGSSRNSTASYNAMTGSKKKTPTGIEGVNMPCENAVCTSKKLTFDMIQTRTNGIKQPFFIRIKPSTNWDFLRGNSIHQPTNGKRTSMTEPSNIGIIMDDLNPATGKLVETEANKWVCSDTMWSPLGTGKLV